MYKRIIAAVFAVTMLLGGVACKASLSAGVPAANPNAFSSLRQKLDEIPEPTFESLEVYTHDIAAGGVAMLIERYPDTKIPLRIFAETSLSVLETQSITMVDLLAMSSSLDEIKNGRVKAYLDIAWTILELNGVIRRNDLAATLTVREQRLVVALMQGIKLGVGDSVTREGVLNSFGPRYGTKRPDPK